MGCGSLIKTITKAVLFVLNLVFTILGLVIAILAIVYYIKLKDLLASASNKDIESSFQTVAMGIIALGVIIFIIAFCGCVGSVVENKCLLTTYAVFMLAIICGKTYISIKYNDVNVVQRPVDQYLNDSFKSKTDTLTFHLVELTVHCCGTTGPLSYGTKIKHGLIPPTCCEKKPTDLESLIKLVHKVSDLVKKSNSSTFDWKNFNEKKCELKNASIGCLEKVHDIIDEYGGMILKYMIAIIIVEALEFFAAVLLCVMKTQRKKKEHY